MTSFTIGQCVAVGASWQIATDSAVVSLIESALVLDGEMPVQRSAVQPVRSLNDYLSYVRSIYCDSGILRMPSGRRMAQYRGTRNARGVR